MNIYLLIYLFAAFIMSIVCPISIYGAGELNKLFIKELWRWNKINIFGKLFLSILLFILGPVWILIEILIVLMTNYCLAHVGETAELTANNVKKWVKKENTND